MKTYKVIVFGGPPEIVKAERFTDENNKIKFYRGGGATPVALFLNPHAVILQSED